MTDAGTGWAISPFQSSSPRYDYWSDAHDLAVERLGFAVSSQILLTVFTGAIGLGKSTVARRVVLDRQARQVIGALPYCAMLNVDPARAILSSFGADPGPGERTHQRNILKWSLQRARADHGLPTLILDDAHRLSIDTLAELFDLAGFDDPDSAVTKLVLIGRPETHDLFKVDLPDLMGPTFALEPMSENDTAAYVRHRMAAAGMDTVFFTDAALSDLFHLTQGNPLRINLICMFAVDEALALGIDRIGAELVRDCDVPAGSALDVPELAALTSTGTEGPSVPLTR